MVINFPNRTSRPFSKEFNLTRSQSYPISHQFIILFRNNPVTNDTML